MRLLFLDDRLPHYLGDNNYPVGGASIRVYALASGLAELGHDVGILTWKGANQFVGKKYPFELIESYERNGGLKGLRFFNRRYRMFQSVKKFRPDYLFQVSAAVNTGVMSMIGNLLNIPFVYLAASNADADGKFAEILQKAEQRMYKMGLRKSSMIIAQNDYQLQHFQTQFPRKKIAKIHNPFFHPGALPAIKMFNERKYIAWVGNFVQVKNVPAAVSIAEELNDFTFKLAGGKTNKTDESSLQAMAKLEQMENVEFVGHMARNEVIEFLSGAYALFNTSDLEGFSNTFLEALAVGTPVVTRNDIDPDNILEKNELGNIVTSNDAIGNAIRAIINEEDYDILAKKRRDYLIKNHDIKVIAQRLINEIKALRGG